MHNAIPVPYHSWAVNFPPLWFRLYNWNNSNLNQNVPCSQSFLHSHPCGILRKAWQNMMNQSFCESPANLKIREPELCIIDGCRDESSIFRLESTCISAWTRKLLMSFEHCVNRISPKPRHHTDALQCNCEPWLPWRRTPAFRLTNDTVAWLNKCILYDPETPVDNSKSLVDLDLHVGPGTIYGVIYLLESKLVLRHAGCVS